MKRHPNARVAPRGREALASRARAGERVSDAARRMVAGCQTASKRLARDRLGEGAADRSRRSGGMGARGRARRKGRGPISFIDRCNWDRPRSACGGLPPMSRIAGVNNLLAHNS